MLCYYPKIKKNTCNKYFSNNEAFSGRRVVYFCPQIISTHFTFRGFLLLAWKWCFAVLVNGHTSACGSLKLCSQNPTFLGCSNHLPLMTIHCKPLLSLSTNTKRICEKYFLRYITFCQVEFSPTSSNNPLTENMCYHIGKKSEEYLREILFKTATNPTQGCCLVGVSPTTNYSRRAGTGSRQKEEEPRQRSCSPTLDHQYYIHNHNSNHLLQ